MGSMHARKLILDADVSLKLAEHPANLDAIQSITHLVQTGKFELVVPDVVAEAFKREKDEVPKRYWKTQRNYLRNARALEEAASDSGKFKSMLDDLSVALTKLEKDVPQSCAAVELLLNSGRLVKSDDTLFAAAARKVKYKRAPASHAQSSSISDCIIWQIVVTEASAGPVTFCTDNIHDFSDPNGDNRRLHPELLAEAAETAKAIEYMDLMAFRDAYLKTVKIIAPPPVGEAGCANCPACGTPCDALIPRPSAYGGWSYHVLCRQCGRYVDTGEPYDD